MAWGLIFKLNSPLCSVQKVVSASNEGIKVYLAYLYSEAIHFCCAFASDYDTKCLKVKQPIELWFRRRKVEITTYIYILLFLLP
jgi:hypothetical protein